MIVHFFRVVGLATLLGLVGCAGDPVAQLLKSNGGFAVVRPPSNAEYLGDVHRSKNLVEKSISMRDVMSAPELKAMMSSRAAQVSIPSTNGSTDFKLSVDAAYVGIVKGDLALTGASKYRVAVSNPVVYDSPFDSHLPELVSTIKRRFPNVSLEGKYIVRSLLEVGGLEYEFFREDGGKIDISADQNLVKGLTAKLGTEWKVTRQGTLTITEPRFIGYRLARIDKDGGLAAAMAPGARPAARQGPQFSKIPLGEYEARDLRDRKKETRHKPRIKREQ